MLPEKQIRYIGAAKNMYKEEERQKIIEAPNIKKNQNMKEQMPDVIIFTSKKEILTN